MSEYGEVKDIEDMVTLYSNLMMESFNAGITEALVIRKEADKVKDQIKSDVRELVEQLIECRKGSDQEMNPLFYDRKGGGKDG